MVIQGNANISSLTGSLARQAVQPQSAPAVHPSAGQPQRETNISRRFDSVTISAERVNAAARLQELRNRLIQEVRANQPAESVEAVREQLQSGTYEVDPKAIAGKMLLFGDTP